MLIISDQLAHSLILDVRSLFCTSKRAKCSQSDLGLDCNWAIPKVGSVLGIMLPKSSMNCEKEHYFTATPGDVIYNME